MQAIKDYENNKWKVIGQKVGKPAKVRILFSLHPLRPSKVQVPVPVPVPVPVTIASPTSRSRPRCRFREIFRLLASISYLLRGWSCAAG